KNPTENISYIRNAGAIFLGNYSPEPLGDYFAGPNHTLQTSGTLAFSSPLGVYDFMKKSSIIHYSKDALQAASNHIITLANTEGLSAHASDIRIRKNDENALIWLKQEDSGNIPSFKFFHGRYRYNRHSHRGWL